MTANERRLDMLYYLSDVRHENIENLINRYHVSRSTILRDVAELSCQAPIYTVQGNGGGIHVQDGWYASQRHMNREQTEFLESLLSGLQPEHEKIMLEIIRSFGNKKIS